MTNTQICVSDLLLLSHQLEVKIEKLQAAGVTYVELLVDGKAWDDTTVCYEKYAPYLLSTGLKFSVHPPAWDTNLTSENKTIREATYLEYCKAIEFAQLIGGKHVVIHPGFCYSPGFDKENAKKRAQELVSRLCMTAKPLDIMLAVENVGYNGSSLFTQDEYIAFVRELDSSAAYLIDTGHAHLNGWNIAELIDKTKDRLCSIHLHDNFADGDTHLPILEGSIKWEPVLTSLREAKTCLPILEYAPGTDLSKVAQSIAFLQQQLGEGVAT